MAAKRPTVLLDHYLKQLKLPTMLREYSAVAQACAQEDQDHIAFLLRLAERSDKRLTGPAARILQLVVN